MTEGSLKSKMAAGMLWKFAERFSAQGVSFLVSLVLARLLSPDDYGTVAIINIFITIADVLLSSGLTSALIQKKDASDKEFSTIFYINLGFSVLLYLMLCISAPFIATVYGMPILKEAIRIFAIRLPISAFQSIQVAYVSKKMEFKKFFWATIGGTITSGFVGIIMAYKGYGVFSLIGQYLTNTLIDTILLWWTVKWVPIRHFSWNAAKPLIKYSWKIMATDLVGTLCNNLGNFIIGLKYSSADLAYYSKGRQLPQLFRVNIYNTMISVLFPGMSSVNEDREKLKLITSKSLRIMAYAVFPIAIGMIAAGEEIIIVLYTAKWLPILPYVIIMCVETLFSVPATVSLQAIKASGYSNLLLKAEIIKKVILLSTIILFVKLGPIAIALSLPFNSFVDLIINGKICKKVFGYGMWNQLYDCKGALFISIGMGAIVYALKMMPISTLPKLIIQVIVGIFSYVVFSFLSKSPEFKFMLGYIKATPHK